VRSSRCACKSKRSDSLCHYHLPVPANRDCFLGLVALVFGNPLGCGGGQAGHHIMAVLQVKVIEFIGPAGGLDVLRHRPLPALALQHT